jgi:hypothetical protein
MSNRLYFPFGLLSHSTFFSVDLLSIRFLPSAFFTSTFCRWMIKGSHTNPEVGRPLFWSAGPLSTAQWTTEIIADQRTGKNSGPALANNRNGASSIPLFCIFLPIFKNVSKRRNYQIMGLIPILILILWNSELWNSELRNSKLRNSELRNSEPRNSELRNSKLWHAVDYSENSGSGRVELQASSNKLQWK